MKISKASVHYRAADLHHLMYVPEVHRCGNCSMYVSPGQCTLVAGIIVPPGVCDRWEEKKKK